MNQSEENFPKDKRKKNIMEVVIEWKFDKVTSDLPLNKLSVRQRVHNFNLKKIK